MELGMSRAVSDIFGTRYYYV